MAARRSSASSVNDPEINLPSPLDDSANVFGDDYAESIAESFAESTDGRTLPAAPVHASRSTSPEQIRACSPDPSRRPSLPSPWASNVNTGLQHRGSLRKSLGAALIGAQHEESTSRNSTYSEMPQSPTGSSFAPSTPVMAQRSPSLMSTTSFARSHSPFQSNSGPSHPYNMYPQGLGMSRTASVATTSTVRSPLNGSSSARPIPAHPYGMYPQNVADDGDIVTNPVIPVGFPGHSDGFHRRLGPDGEEQDIVGADGHTEQLPPYTRFPEEAPAKMGSAVPAMPAIGEAVDLTDQQDSANESTPFFPNQPHDFSPSRGSSPTMVDQSQNPFSDQNAVPKYADSDGDKTWSEMSWKERRDAKIFGVLPVWFFVLIMVSLIVIAAICGGVIGGWLTKHHRPPTGSDDSNLTSQILPTPLAEVATATVTTTKTTMIDASEVTATPTGFGPLPTGDFKIDVSDSSQASSMCLAKNDKGDQRKAWSCLMEPDSFSVTVDWNGTNPYLSMRPYANLSAPQYGAQPPSFFGQTMKLAQDLNSPELGTAFQFQMLYNKLVILEQKYLSVASSNIGNSKRDDQTDKIIWNKWMGIWSRKSVAPNDNPWFCYFNSTLLEGFVYVQNDTIAAAAAQASSSFSVDGASPVPTTAVASSTVNPDQNASITPPPRVRDVDNAIGVGPTIPTDSARASSVISNSFNNNSFDNKRPYPKRIKLEERRLWSQQFQNQPYCQQMSTSSDGVMRPVLNGFGEPILVFLNENSPPDSTNPNNAGSKRSLEARGLPQGGCFCQWLWS